MLPLKEFDAIWSRDDDVQLLAVIPMGYQPTEDTLEFILAGFRITGSYYMRTETSVGVILWIVKDSRIAVE
jgi:hypothetical protein